MITSDSLKSLRDEISSRLSKKRYTHTLGVERAARILGTYCLPERILELSAAALLHDIAKELPRHEQLRLMDQSEQSFSEEDFESEALFHAFAAPVVIKAEFPEFATKDILSSVFLHTSGGENMSLFDEIIFLADFVEDGREYDACRELRAELFHALENADNIEERCKILHYSVLRVIDFTIYYLRENKKQINGRMLLARSAIADKLISVF